MGVERDLEADLLECLTERQRQAVCSDSRRVLVVAGAGSGKTDVMARRIAWWTAAQGVPRDSIVAFTERAAEEMQFRVRRRLDSVQEPGTDSTLGGM